MLRAISALVHLGQLGISARAGYHSYVAITNLLQWEDTSEKAAKWSDTAATQLHKTRTTQASGALAIVSTAVTASVLLLIPPISVWMRVVLNLANGLFAFTAQAHVEEFWQKKWKVPLAKGYNEGIKNSKMILQYLKILAATWVVSGILTVFSLSS